VTETAERLAAALADRYLLQRELGQGGMATVYLARDLRHDRQVAVKVLRPELAAVIGADRFLSEIKTTANLQHPHILPLFDSGVADSFLYYVMPYVEGVSLRDRITREHQLPVEDAVRIAREVAGALDSAHRHGVIHRDIKPENILLHDGSALVADFGIALAVSTAGTRMTETGMSLGTPHYMSPEQAMGEREITARSDVYALGCVTYEMLVGEPPFTGPTAQAIIARVMTEEPRRLTIQRRSVPPEVEGAVLHALEKLPADRFATAAQFADALAGRGGTVATRVPVRPVALGNRGWRRALPVAAGVALLLIGLGAWGWLRARAAEQPVERRYVSLGDSAQVQAAIWPVMTISPDGSRFAFVGDTAGRIWVKERGSLDPSPLAGTERARSPQFSPDGQWIAYESGGELRKVRSGGGASIVIADSAFGFGIAWLDDGTIAYPSSSLLQLRRVSADGGAVTTVLSEAVLHGLGIESPTPLPDARGILYNACTSGCAVAGLHVLDLRTMQDKLLLKDVVVGWYLAPGRLLYGRQDGTLLIAPFDLKTLSLRGAGVPVLQNVAVLAAVPQLVWSASGRLVYVIAQGGSRLGTPLRMGPDGVASLIDSSMVGDFNSLALSPDGSRLAVGLRNTAGLNIWIKQLDHGPMTRLTFSGRDRRPAWSPDGRQVAFVRDSGASADVYARNVDGSGGDHRMAHLDRPVQEVVWSADGRWLLLRTESASRGGGDILAVRTTGDSTPVPMAVSQFAELTPALSPDGRWLAYISDEAGTPELYVRPFATGDAGRWQVSNDGASSPVWSRDGKELYFINGSGDVVAAQVAPGGTFTVPALKPLFSATRFGPQIYHQVFDVTKDGRFIFLGSPSAGTARSAQLVEVDNWLGDLKTRLAR
jgi:serine/threonine-protein kinase